jgi:hypothetical protein
MLVRQGLFQCECVASALTVEILEEVYNTYTLASVELKKGSRA